MLIKYTKDNLADRMRWGDLKATDLGVALEEWIAFENLVWVSTRYNPYHSLMNPEALSDPNVQDFASAVEMKDTYWVGVPDMIEAYSVWLLRGRLQDLGVNPQVLQII